MQRLTGDDDYVQKSENPETYAGVDGRGGHNKNTAGFPASENFLGNKSAASFWDHVKFFAGVTGDVLRYALAQSWNEVKNTWAFWTQNEGQGT